MFFLAKYATAVHVYIPIIKRAVVDFAVSADWTPAAGDVKISIDGAAAANVTNLPTAIAMGNTAMWDFSLTSGELTGKKIMVTVADAATKAVEDQMFTIRTFGNASAEYVTDFSDGVRAGLTALPNAAAEAAGGLYTRGAGAGQINQAANGQVDGNVVAWRGGTPDVLSTGKVAADLKLWLAAAPNALIAGRVDANAQVVGDKTGYSLTQAFPANFASLAIDASGRIDLGKWIGVAPSALVSGLVQAVGVLRNGTAQGGAAGSITLDAGASAVDGFYTDVLVWIVSGTGAGQARRIDTYTGSTKVATVRSFFKTAPDATSVFVLIPAGGADLEAWLQAAPNVLISGRVDANAQVIGDKAGYALSAAGVQAIWDALTANLTTVGSIGKRLADDVDATVSSRATQAQILTDATPFQGARIDAAISSRAAPGAAMALVVDALDSVAVATSGAQEIADALLDRAAAIEGFTPRELLRLFAAVLIGKASGLDTTTAVYRDVADLKARITATVDTFGNRTAITRDAT